MPKIVTVKDFYLGDDVEHFLGERIPEPDAGWKSIQRVRPVEGQPWFRAYPLTGGAISVQQHRIVEVREATQDDIERAKRLMPHNPALSSVQTLF